MTSQPARGFRGRSKAIWGLLVPCLIWAGMVDVDLEVTDQPCTLAVGDAQAEDSLVSGQSSAQRILIAVPPLSRVTSVTAAFSGPTTVAALSCSCTAAMGVEVSRQAAVYRERKSGRLVFAECWASSSQSSPGVRESGFDRPPRLRVRYEPLPIAERTLRERLLSDYAITDDSIRIFSNPTDARAWYSVPDTSLSLLFGGDRVPRDFQFAELAEMPLRSQVVIVVHAGGWGNVPIENARDIVPIIEGIREDLGRRGLKSIVVRFRRNQGDFWGRMGTLSEIFGLHHGNANRLSREIDRFLSRHPQQTLIMIGLSNGAQFADGVMRRLSKAAQSRVCAIEVGLPFWCTLDAEESVLRLDNHGSDPFSTGEPGILLRTVCLGLLRQGHAKPADKKSSEVNAFHVPGHDYSWPGVRQEVISFLEAWLYR